MAALVYGSAWLIMGTACSSDDPDGVADASGSTSSEPGSTSSADSTTSSDGSSGGAGSSESGGSSGGDQTPSLDPDDFDPDGLAGEITVVSCTLSNGEESTCFSIPIGGSPADHDVGPFCPRNIADGPDVSGLWIESGAVYDADGPFIADLAEFYGDPGWQLYDPETGDIRVTETVEACEAAAQPDVPEEYNNYCVECSLEELGGGVEQTFLIPQFPVLRETPAEIGGMNKVGLALNGVTMDPPAPVDAILSAYTIAAFDDCGGHVNPFAGYHYHAATGCPRQIAQDDGHAPRIGYALDGFAIYAMTDADGQESDDLDACRGHYDDIRGYHYQVASPGENMFIGCYAGEIAGELGGGPPGGGPPGGPPGGE